MNRLLPAAFALSAVPSRLFAKAEISKVTIQSCTSKRPLKSLIP
jgi:hypothetical protein